MSWKVEIIANSAGQWTGDQLRFARYDDAKAHLRDLCLSYSHSRGTWAVSDWRVIPSDDPVNVN